jgi:chromosome segregation ATPase
MTAMAGMRSKLQSLAYQLNSETEQANVLDELSDERAEAKGVAGDKEPDAEELLEIAPADEDDEESGDQAAGEEGPAPTLERQGEGALLRVKAVVKDTDADVKAMQDRLAEKERENEQLRQLLTQADSYENGLWLKFKKFKEVAAKATSDAAAHDQDVPSLKHSIEALQKDKVRLDMKLGRQAGRVAALKGQLGNITKIADKNNDALSWAQLHMKSQQRQNSRLLDLVNNAEDTAKALNKKIASSERNRTELEGTLDAVKNKFQQKQIHNQHVDQTRESVEWANAQATDNAEAAERSVKVEETRVQAIEKKLDPLTKQLDEEQRRLSEEQHHGWELRRTSKTLEDTLKDENRNATLRVDQLRHVSSIARSLRKSAVRIREEAADVDQEREKAQQSLDFIKTNSARAETEIKRLRGSGPNMEAKVEDEQKIVQQASEQAKIAFEARDAEKAMLTETQTKTTKLEEQYAAVVKIVESQMKANNSDKEETVDKDDSTDADADAVSEGDSNTTETTDAAPPTPDATATDPDDDEDALLQKSKGAVVSLAETSEQTETLALSLGPALEEPAGLAEPALEEPLAVDEVEDGEAA